MTNDKAENISDEKEKMSEAKAGETYVGENIQQEPPLEKNAEEIISPEQKLQDEIKILNDKYLRLYSEFENFKKRASRERTEFLKYAGSEIISSMLTVLDDFDRALKSISETENEDAVMRGVVLVHNKMKNILTQKGLTEMKSAGEKFDTDLHEAVAGASAPSEEMKGKIVEELEKGYFFYGKVIRHAKVIVAN